MQVIMDMKEYEILVNKAKNQKASSGEQVGIFAVRRRYKEQVVTRLMEMEKAGKFTFTYDNRSGKATIARETVAAIIRMLGEEEVKTDAEGS